MLLVGFLFGEVEVNKQQLIDKAIDDLKLAEEDQFFGKKFLYRTQLTDGRFAYYGTDFPYLTDDLVCAKHEFQARKAERDAMTNNIELINQARKELGIENTSIIARSQLNALEAKISEIKSRKLVDELTATTNHWYDYENQKALRLPPAGEVVEFLWGGVSYGEVEFMCSRGNNVVYWMISRDTVDSAALPTAEFRPLDWNKRRIAAVNELVDLIKTKGVEGITAAICADSIFAAGYRKCDNKTQSDKE